LTDILVFQADRLPLEVKGRREEAIVRCKEEEEEEEDHHHHHHHHDSMPTFNVQTNVPLDDCVLVSDILKQTSKAVANIIGKPESVRNCSYAVFEISFECHFYTKTLKKSSSLQTDNVCTTMCLP
jgi:hypothetical protein